MMQIITDSWRAAIVLTQSCDKLTSNWQWDQLRKIWTDSSRSTRQLLTFCNHNPLSKISEKHNWYGDIVMIGAYLIILFLIFKVIFWITVSLDHQTAEITSVIIGHFNSYCITSLLLAVTESRTQASGPRTQSSRPRTRLSRPRPRTSKLSSRMRTSPRGLQHWSLAWNEMAATAAQMTDLTPKAGWDCLTAQRLESLSSD